MYIEFTSDTDDLKKLIKVDMNEKSTYLFLRCSCDSFCCYEEHINKRLRYAFSQLSRLKEKQHKEIKNLKFLSVVGFTKYTKVMKAFEKVIMFSKSKN